jgi:electron transport complex protein RnfG
MIHEILKPTLIITLVAFICTVSLSYVSTCTDPVLVKRSKERQDLALQLVLPGYSISAARKMVDSGLEFQYWEAEKRAGNKVMKGYAFITRSPGYADDIESMVGVDEKGVILGLSIINQSETPGLGARSIEVANRETIWDHIRGGIPDRDHYDETRMPWFQNQFKGLKAGERIRLLRLGVWNPNIRTALVEKNAISALTGATITSSAVVRGIEQGMVMLNKARAMDAAGAAGGKK